MFRPLGSKRITAVQARQFWVDYDAGKKEPQSTTFGKKVGTRQKPRPPWFNLSGNWKRTPVVVTRGMLGTVRDFRNRGDLHRFMQTIEKETKLVNLKFQHFIFQPTQILAIDKKNLRVLERVYPATTVVDLLEESQGAKFRTRYSWLFLRKLKGLSKSKIASVKFAIARGHYELASLPENLIPWHTDVARVNTLVVDFNFKTMIPTLCHIDHGGSIQL